MVLDEFLQFIYADPNDLLLHFILSGLLLAHLALTDEVTYNRMQLLEIIDVDCGFLPAELEEDLLRVEVGLIFNAEQVDDPEELQLTDLALVNGLEVVEKFGEGDPYRLQEIFELDEEVLGGMRHPAMRLHFTSFYYIFKQSFKLQESLSIYTCFLGGDIKRRLHGFLVFLAIRALICSSWGLCRCRLGLFPRACAELWCGGGSPSSFRRGRRRKDLSWSMGSSKGLVL